MNQNQRARRRIVPLALVGLSAAFAFAGCARATVGSDIKPNGSWVRTVQLHGPAPDKTGGLMPVAQLEDAFKIPGAPWVVTKETTKEGLTVTCKRNMQLGESATHDVVCRTKVDGKLVDVAVNECSVKESAPGEYTYKEVIRWIGPKPKPFMDIDTVKTVKAILPPGLATDTNVQHLGESLGKSFMLTMMGPPDPMITELLSLAMLNPDLAQRKISSRLSDGLDKALITEFGEKMTAEQRKTSVQKLIQTVSDVTQSKANVDPTKGNDNMTLSALTFSVKLPGKIISTNGLVDSLTNEVYWGMYPESASLGQDVVLTATCQAK